MVEEKEDRVATKRKGFKTLQLWAPCRRLHKRVVQKKVKPKGLERSSLINGAGRLGQIGTYAQGCGFRQPIDRLDIEPGYTCTARPVVDILLNKQPLSWASWLYPTSRLCPRTRRNSHHKWPETILVAVPLHGSDSITTLGSTLVLWSPNQVHAPWHSQDPS